MAGDDEKQRQKKGMVNPHGIRVGVEVNRAPVVQRYPAMPCFYGHAGLERGSALSR
jgi:hypothetical protein